MVGKCTSSEDEKGRQTHKAHTVLPIDLMDGSSSRKFNSYEHTSLRIVIDKKGKYCATIITLLLINIDLIVSTTDGALWFRLAQADRETPLEIADDGSRLERTLKLLKNRKTQHPGINSMPRGWALNATAKAIQNGYVGIVCTVPML